MASLKSDQHLERQTSHIVLGMVTGIGTSKLPRFYIKNMEYSDIRSIKKRSFCFGAAARKIVKLKILFQIR